ncbi:MAG TPA: hypothetical protein VJK72_00925 [Candidatus Nanoarchaeia archaeon]|nr:hypothetical protein [Candidatus Nanoarchaeia archaeon]
MARQFIFRTNIDPARLSSDIAPDRSSAEGRLPYYQILPFADAGFRALCASPNGTKAVVTATHGGVVYELASRNVFNPDTNNVDESPPYETFGELEMIASIHPRTLEFELTGLFFDDRMATRVEFAREKAEWSKALEEYKAGKLCRNIEQYKFDKRDW